ncbi:MAG: DUF3782 domain-containing protein [Cytophagales bacterium]|nr:DUF3782 domain-containing protein [Cytophagales bacterium]
MQYTKHQILDIVNKQLLFWIKKDETVKNAIFELVNHKYPARTETEKSIKEILQELAKGREELAKDREEQAKDRKEQAKNREEQAKNRAKDREEQTKKWEAQEKKWAEWNKKWEVEREENNKKYAENQKIINEILQDIRELNRKYTVNIGAIGDRWGRHSEFSFREGLREYLRSHSG